MFETKLIAGGIAGLLMLLSAVGAYFYAKHVGVMEERGRWEVKQAAATKADLEGLRTAVEAGSKIAQNALDRLNKGKAERVIDRGVIEREIKTNTVYAVDCLPATGLVQYNRISAGLRVVPVGTPGPKPDATVPAGDGTAGGGRQERDAAAQPSGRP